MPLRAALIIIFAALLGLAGQGSAGAATVLSAADAFHLTARRDGDRIELDWRIAAGHYLYRDKMTVAGPSGPIAIATPPGTIEDDPTFGRSEIYTDAVTARFAAPAGATVTITYQGCQKNGICYPPIHRTLDTATLALSSTTAGFSLPQGSGWTAGPATGAATPAAGSDTASDRDGLIDRLAERGGAALIIVSFLGFGLLLAFTPCVLPMFPILGGMLARDGERLTARRGFLLSLTYVTAMAAAFGVLGVAAAWGGQNLQVALQSPVAIGAMSALFVLLALSMFGAFDLALPAGLAVRFRSVGSAGRGSIGGAALLGFTSALIVGPCVTPPLAAALLYVGKTGDMALGAAALFALGFGQGLPLIAFGTLGAGVLPKRGAWMESVKIVFGFVFLGAAVFMMSRIVTPQLTMALAAFVLIAAAVFLGGFDTLAPGTGPARRAAKAGGLIAGLAGAILLVGAAAGSSDPWRPLSGLAAAGTQASGMAGEHLSFRKAADRRTLDDMLAAAQAKARPALVYFTAGWCVSCRAIERDVLSKPAAATILDDFDLIEVDLTKLDPAKRALMKGANVVGPPTMVFYRPDGSEEPAARLVGEIDADALERSANGTRASRTASTMKKGIQ